MAGERLQAYIQAHGSERATPGNVRGLVAAIREDQVTQLLRTGSLAEFGATANNQVVQPMQPSTSLS